MTKPSAHSLQKAFIHEVPVLDRCISMLGSKRAHETSFVVNNSLQAYDGQYLAMRRYFDKARDMSGVRFWVGSFEVLSTIYFWYCLARGVSGVMNPWTTGSQGYDP